MGKIYKVGSLLLMILGLWTLINASSTEYLVSIHKDMSEGFEVVEVVEDEALLITDQAGLTEIEQRNIDHSVLDVDPRGKLYFLVFPLDEPLEAISRLGSVIDLYKECVLLRTTQAMIPELNRLKVELSRLTLKPVVRRDVALYDFGNRTVSRDTLIEQMLYDVDYDTIFNSVLQLQNFYTRYSTSDSNRIAAVNWIRDKLIAYGCDSVYTHTFSATYGDNVVGIEAGKQHSSVQYYVLIGAHLDDVPSFSYAPGADDNASGVAAMLEAARVTQNYNFAHTIRFAAFNAEEQGLIGSDSLATFANSQNDTIIAALCYDMIGHVTAPLMDTMRLRYTSFVPGCSLFATVFYQAVADTYTQLKIRHVRYTGTTGSSDHASFWRNGYVSTGGIERILCPGYHTIGDTIGSTGFNSLSFATHVIQTAIAVLATLAVPIDTGTGVSELPFQKNPLSFTVRPNPGRDFTIGFTVAKETEAIGLKIYDCAGRVVNTLASGRYSGGRYSFDWNGHDVHGRPVVPGIYFIVLMRGGRQECCKTILLA